MDFTISTYKKLLVFLSRQGYSFQPILNILVNQNSQSITLRHDIDKLPQNALAFARIEQEMGIRGTYFFRIVPQSFDAKIIEEIAKLGHEVGYHYEDVDLAYRQIKAAGCGRKAEGRRDQGTERLRDEVTKGRSDKETMRLGDDVTMRPNDGKIKSQREEDRGPSNEDRVPDNGQPEPLFEKAIELFAKRLEQFRKIYPVTSICMHGSPLSRWDSRLLWKYYDYHDFGIEAEPYFDVNFEEVLYLTDTGRRWNGEKVSVRDKAAGGRRQAEGRRDLETEGLRDKETGRLWDDEKMSQNEGKTISEREENPATSNQYPGTASGDPDPFAHWVVKPLPGSLLNPTQKTIEFQNQYSFRHTRDIIRAAENNELPDKIMFTFHPQRWTDRTAPWFRELVMQNVKNVAKYFLVKIR